jgi:hypothetical protein
MYPNDADIEMAQLVEAAATEDALRKAGQCPHGSYQVGNQHNDVPNGKARCFDCGTLFASEDDLWDERNERLGN